MDDPFIVVVLARVVVAVVGVGVCRSVGVESKRQPGSGVGCSQPHIGPTHTLPKEHSSTYITHYDPS